MAVSNHCLLWIKAPDSEPLKRACLRSSGENRSTPSPEAMLLLPWGASPAPKESVSSQLCLVLIRNLWQEMCSCFVAETPAYGEWVATSRVGPTAQHGVGGFSLSQIPVSEGSWWPGSSYFSLQKAACSEKSKVSMLQLFFLSYGWFRKKFFPEV